MYAHKGETTLGQFGWLTVMMFITIFYTAFCLWKIWGWYVGDYFELGYGAFMGFNLMVAIYMKYDGGDIPYSDTVRGFWKRTMGKTLILGIAWVALKIMEAFK